MPWNMNDYPSSFKNFDDLLRKKAIDISNALLDEGYDENRAIPIATKQAKEWYQNASIEEKDAFQKEEGPNKQDEHDSSTSTDLLDKNVKVFYAADENVWKVQTREADQADSLHDNKENAITRAEEIAENKKTTVEIYKKDGELQKKENKQ